MNEAQLAEKVLDLAAERNARLFNEAMEALRRDGKPVVTTYEGKPLPDTGPEAEPRHMIGLRYDLAEQKRERRPSTGNTGHALGLTGVASAFLPAMVIWSLHQHDKIEFITAIFWQVLIPVWALLIAGAVLLKLRIDDHYKPRRP